MTPTEAITKLAPTGTPPFAGDVRRIRFVKEASPAQESLLRFLDSVPHVAICLAADSISPDGGGIDIATVVRPSNDSSETGHDLIHWLGATPHAEVPPIAIMMHGAQIVWTPARAAILATAERMEPFLLAMIEFTYYEQSLTAIESEIRDSGPVVERETPLAHRVEAWDPPRFDEIGKRLEETLHRRLRLTRISPRLLQPIAKRSLLANQLVDRLREKLHIEERLESAAAQIDALERVLELSSQKINDFTFARQQRTMEWIIVLLLAAEAVLIFIDLLHTLNL